MRAAGPGSRGGASHTHLSDPSRPCRHKTRGNPVCVNGRHPQPSPLCGSAARAGHTQPGRSQPLSTSSKHIFPRWALVRPARTLGCCLCRGLFCRGRCHGRGHSRRRGAAVARPRRGHGTNIRWIQKNVWIQKMYFGSNKKNGSKQLLWMQELFLDPERCHWTA